MTLLNVTSLNASPLKTTGADDGFVQFFMGSEAAEAVTLEALWAIAHQTHTVSQPTQDAFLPIGLRLDHAKKPWQYYCTPQNVKTFASTGQDGVHYSFLHSDSSTRPLSESPVVMTVPMNFNNQNMVIAENLYEFLCLGCRAGYAQLEMLADETLSETSSAFGMLTHADYAGRLSRLQKSRLQLLNDAFLLTPVTDLAGRMRQLQSAYLDKLQLGEVETVSSYRTQTQRRKSCQLNQQRSAYRPSLWL